MLKRYDKKINFCTRFCLILAISSGLLSLNRPARSAAQHSGQAAHTVSRVLRATLPNGLGIVIVPDTFAPIVRTQMIYHVGSAMTPAAFPGTAHALEHMMFNGARQVSRTQLSAISALIGDRNNAFTTEDATQYYFEAPAQNLDLLLRIEADRMQNLNISEADWQRERGAIEQEVSRDLSMPIERFLVQQNQVLFGGTPYAHDALGTRASFDRTDTKRLRQFYETWYQPNNATLLIVGDVEPAATLTQVKTLFANIPSHPLPPRPEINPRPSKAQVIRLKSDYATGIFVMSFPAPGSEDANGATTQVLADALNNERGPLAGLRAHGDALYAAASYAPRLKAGALMVYVVYPKGADPEPLMRKVQAILDEVRQHGVPSTFVSATKRKVLTDLALSQNSVSGLASTWSDALAVDPKSSPEARAGAIAHVTDADVTDVAHHVLDPNFALTGIITPSDDKDASNSEGRAAEHFLPPAKSGVELPSWATRNLAQLDKPPKYPQPKAFVLKNGLKLLVKTEPASQTVQLWGMIRHNAQMQEPEGKEDVLDLTDRLFLFGSAKHDRIKFAETLDMLGADADTGLNFSVTALKPNFDDAFRLMAEVERHPAFPQAAFDTFKREEIAALPGILSAPNYRFGRMLRKKLNPSHDPALRDPSPASVRRLSIRDIQDTFRKNFRPDLTTIVIIGNITPDHALSLVKEAFGAWQNIGPTPTVDLPPRPPNISSSFNTRDPGRTQSDVTLVQTLTDGVQNPDRYPLGFGMSVLSSGFNARLLQKLRVDTGLVYSVQGALNWSAHRGAIVINYGADPDKAQRAKDLALQEIVSLCKTPISSTELRTTKASMLRAMPMQRASFDAVAATYLSLSDLNLPLDEKDRESDAIYEMTQPQVQRAFCRQVTPLRMVEAVLGPQMTTSQ